MARMTMTSMAERLEVLEARESVQRTLARYLDLCDVPRPDLSWEDMAALFAEDAVWEGVGPAYSGKFGRVEGRPAILAMLAEFLPPEPHFAQNVHLAINGFIDVSGSTATGQWIMQQLSAYCGGGSELVAARLSVGFDIHGGSAMIRHFRTERLFTAQLSALVHVN